MRDKADFTEGDVALSLAKGSTFFLGLPKKILAKKTTTETWCCVTVVSFCAGALVKHLPVMCHCVFLVSVLYTLKQSFVSLGPRSVKFGWS